MFVGLLTVFIGICFVGCDISHLQHDVFNNLNHFYAPQVFVSSDPPALPEIIINKKTQDHGYNYPKPGDSYLPPGNPGGNFPPQESFPDRPENPPAPFPPIVVGDPQIDAVLPSNEYLPPQNAVFNSLGKKGLDSSDIVVSYKKGENFKGETGGYVYQPPLAPTTSTTQRPLLFPIGSDIPQFTTEGPGYIYTPGQPAATYLPPGITERSPKEFGPYDSPHNNLIRLHVNEMRCVSNEGGFFKTIMKVDSFLGSLPTVDNDSVDNRCDLRFFRSHLIVNIKSEHFQKCGVINCGDNLCLKIRFPLIRGLKTAGDSLLTLQCKAQDRIVAKTHALKMALSNDQVGRSIGAYAQGGGQQSFRTHVELLRKSSNGNLRHVDQNGVVQLGEDLQLIAHAEVGDGWNYTRISDVHLQRVSSSGETLKSATLINSSGCVNPAMRSICPFPPRFEPPLGHRLSFKAIMFQGMKSGEEILMSIKITGCIDQRDCHVNGPECYGGNHHVSSLTRSKRTTKKYNSTEHSKISTISFRVEIPSSDEGADVRTHSDSAILIIGGTLGLVCVLSFMILFTYTKLRN